MIALLAIALTGCASTHVPGPDAVRRGPLPARSNGPLSQNFPVLRPRAAATTPPGVFDLQLLSAYSSIFEDGEGEHGTVTFDGELWRTSAMLRTGIGPATDLDVEIPFMFATSGFLDVFVEAWHDLLGLPDSGREERERFDYDMTVTGRGGSEAYSLEGDRIGLGDVPVVVTHRLFGQDGLTPATFLQACVELPTGDEDAGFGNGALDWVFGIGCEWSVGECSFGAGLGWTERVRPTKFIEAGFRTQDTFAGRGDFEWRWYESSSVLIGLRHESAVSTSLPIEELDGDVLDLDVGLAFDGVGDSTWLVGFTEDLVSKSSPDFTAFVGFRTTF